MINQADVVFFKASDDFISKTIAKLTKSKYTHVGLVLKNSTNDKVWVMEANRFIRTHQTEICLSDKTHAIYRLEGLTDAQKRNILEYTLSVEGSRYDYLQILGIIIRMLFKLNIGNLFNRANKLICSELIDIALYTSGVPRRTERNLGDVTPQELLDEYDFRLVESFTKDT